MLLSEKLKRHEHFGMADEALQLESRIKILETMLEQRESCIRNLDETLERRDQEIVKLRSLQFKVKNIMHSCQAMMEVFKS